MGKHPFVLPHEDVFYLGNREPASAGHRNGEQQDWLPAQRVCVSLVVMVRTDGDQVPRLMRTTLGAVHNMMDVQTRRSLAPAAAIAVALQDVPPQQRVQVGMTAPRRLRSSRATPRRLHRLNQTGSVAVGLDPTADGLVLGDVCTAVATPQLGHTHASTWRERSSSGDRP
jgi:hypothetical protein